MAIAQTIEKPNKALHLTAIPLCYIAAGELRRWTTKNKMYRFPKDLDLSPIIGEFTTQFRVGQWDIQFTLGKVDFTIQSQITLFENKEQIGQWIEGQWPDPEFIKLFNSEISEWELISDQLLVLKFVNGIEMHLTDNSDQYESMQISFSGDEKQWII